MTEVKSINFEFLRPAWEDLATLGAFAEQYALPDPPSATDKLRTFSEQIVQYIYHMLGVPKPYQTNLNDPPPLPRADRQTAALSRSAPANSCDQFMLVRRPTGKECKARCGRGPRRP
jgi:hypothetical protein